MNKFYFPKLAQHLKEKGITKAEFSRATFKVSETPKARTWANAASKKNGITETYANKCKRILLKLGYPEDVASFQTTDD
uniref:Uncharacterized protein n=1 Tax=Candidatus Kentrum sp. FW TaxID=2126338 RepID=A0A450TX68_9GAMM|nr:MAG: hypothetical protein BECKFW1821C_GA0114237_10553 [Candidatus Kentron sp. FW]